MAANDNAFPLLIPNTGGAEIPGLSKREYFAGLAMQGLLANSYMHESLDKLVFTENHEISQAGANERCKMRAQATASAAVEAADALIEALAK